MTHVSLKVFDVGTYAEVVRAKLPFSRIEGGVVVLHSQLSPKDPLNEHLVWLWCMLKHERRVLKSAVAGGARIVCECTVPKGPIRILPNGAELLHLLGAELVLEAK